MESHLLRQDPPPVLHGRGLVAAQRLVGPLIPGLLAEVDLGGLVQSELPDPGVLIGEVPHFLGLVAAEAGKSGPQGGDAVRRAY